MATINIICNDWGWIYEEFVRQFKLYSRHNIVVNSSGDIDYYIPYYDVPNKITKPSAAWFSHQELKNPLNKKFVNAGHVVDVAISQSQKYAEVLKSSGVKNVIQIRPGVDLEHFNIKPSPPKRKQLVAGYIGRSYTSSNRKNPGLLRKISMLKWVDLRVSGGKVGYKDMSNFYADLDLIVSPSHTEGGPMALYESLSCGRPFICFDGVGVSREYGLGVVRIKGGDDAFIGHLKKIWNSGAWEKWRNEDIKKRMRAQVLDHTWENFVADHDNVFDGMIK